ncbi:MAG TPA: alkaline phosphatase family protein [Solirubrobacterales bacterium]|jgi:phospholipase C|nr:alkaline phosphatase family protein [Solirubrobacterales bacterium]
MSSNPDSGTGGVGWLLRLLKPLLPAKFRGDIDLLNAPVPATPTGKVKIERDEAIERLGQVEHIVVLMLENRSFDHMLGYLSQEGGRSDIEGLPADPRQVNTYEGSTYASHHLDRTKLATEAEDPGHSGSDVREQLANENTGFAANFAKHAAHYVAKEGGPMPDPGLVMGYYDAEDLPVYDFLAEHFMVCDHWFSSVPGATWPNRLYAVAGRAEGSHDDLSPPLYDLPSFPRFLDQTGVDWRWYSTDPASLRMIDPEYRLSHHDRFSYFDKRKLSVKERVVGGFLEEGPSFLDDAAHDNLPAVSWIDPHFKDAHMLGPNSNDDHPPEDVTAGQDLVLTIYHALRRSKAWPKTLFLITYDEHGGFFDHVSPPPSPDDDPKFNRYGVRVPALIVSPFVPPRSTARDAAGERILFDHTSIIKTILLRHCLDENDQIPDMGKRVSQANHLGQVLAEPRAETADHSHLGARMAKWRSDWATARFGDPAAKARPPQQLTELQDGFVRAARRLREAGLPDGHP